MVFTMDERCAALKAFGATFCRNIEECPDIPSSLGEGIKAGRHYEEMLKKMELGEDGEPSSYLESWHIEAERIAREAQEPFRHRSD